MVNSLDEFFAQEESSIPVYDGPGPQPEHRDPLAGEDKIYDSSTDYKSAETVSMLTPDRECQIVRDLLPIYSDGDCSLYTRDFVMNHLERCECCKNILDNMETDVSISIITDPEADLYRLKKAMFKKQYNTIALLTVFFTALACLFSFSFIADSVEDGLDAKYEDKYHRAVAEYKRELAEGNQLEDLENKIWGMIENTTEDAQNDLDK